MTELERYQPPVDDDPIHDWVQLMRPAAELARGIHETDFAPKALRGSVGAVTAAILTGVEWHIGPMTALAHIHVIEGRPTPSAHLQSAMVRRAGHDVEPVEQTNTRCVLRCRRRGSDRWFEFGYTMDDARSAGLAGKKNWRENPQDMLYARAVGRACRRLFSDVVMGMPFNAEEAGDGIGDDEPATPDAAPAAVDPPKRTAQRRTTPKTRPAAADPIPPPPADPIATAEDLPPLPGEPGYDDESVVVHAAPAPEPEPDAITAPQLKHLKTLLTSHGLDRDRGLTVYEEVTGRRVNSTKDLTRREASLVIDTLIRLEVVAGEDLALLLYRLAEISQPGSEQFGEEPE